MTEKQFFPIEHLRAPKVYVVEQGANNQWKTPWAAQTSKSLITGHI